MSKSLLTGIFLLLFSCQKESSVTNSISEYSYNVFDQPKISSEKFGLPDISHGWESYCLRIWYDHSFSDIMPVFEIKFSSSGWESTLYAIIYDFEVKAFETTVKETRKVQLTDEIDEEELLTKLNELKIHELPEMDDIPGLIDGWLDGSTYSVEIATSNSYKVYSYHVPEEFKNKYWQTKNMVSILNVVQSYSGIPWKSKENREWEFYNSIRK